MKPIYLSEFLTSDMPPTLEHFLLDKFKPYWQARVGIGGKSSVYDKYQQWAVGMERADRHGITMQELKKKQGTIETMQEEGEAVPDETKFMKELVEMLRSGKMAC